MSSGDHLLHVMMQGEEPLPEWALFKVPENTLHIMQGALTKDGRKTGNAVITGISITKERDYQITVVTEAGNIIHNLNSKEFDELYWPGKWVMRYFPTFESHKKWQEHLEYVQSQRFGMECS